MKYIDIFDFRIIKAILLAHRYMRRWHISLSPLKPAHLAAALILRLLRPYCKKMLKTTMKIVQEGLANGANRL